MTCLQSLLKWRGNGQRTEPSPADRHREIELLRADAREFMNVQLGKQAAAAEPENADSAAQFITSNIEQRRQAGDAEEVSKLKQELQDARRAKGDLQMFLDSARQSSDRHLEVFFSPTSPVAPLFLAHWHCFSASCSTGGDV